VAEIYGRSVQASLGGKDRCGLFQFPAGEESKTRETWRDLTDGMLDAGYGRDAAVVALGGGVVGDVAGFVAATYLRGVPYIQVPTSLLAMIDSSVGGKTGVDSSHGKNLIGAFHQPAVVVADMATIESLPAVHVSAGLAEAVKHAVIADPEYLARLVSDANAILERNRGALLRTVKRSVEIKAEVVSQDECERGKRAILNFGHTIGHVIETATEFRMLHGEAVALGMIAEADLGVWLGITSPDVPRVVLEGLQRLGLPTQMQVGRDGLKLRALMKLDKKGREGAVRFALPRDVGDMARAEDGGWTHTVPEPVIERVLRRFV
jgi:3-dehydroquinate synthase